MTDRVGQQLGNYRLQRLLGRGGFADVYLGDHIYLETQAAIKVLHAQLHEDDEDHFRTEARTIARLVHPHIVRVLEFGVQETTPFLVIDYAPNGTLRKRYPKGARVPLQQVVTYVKQMADALDYAHEHKVIHRDVKPENMLIGRRSELLLSDFGIALVTQSTRSGQSTQHMQELAGTIAYMAPEQIQTQACPQSDQYSLAIVVYEWISGERPFQGSFTEIAVKHTLAPPPSLRQKVPELSPAIEAVVMRALSKQPEQRYSTVLEFATALEQVVLQEQIQQPPLTTVVLPPEKTLTGSLTTTTVAIEQLDESRDTAPLPDLEVEEQQTPSLAISAVTLPPRIGRRALLAGVIGGTALLATGTAVGFYLLKNVGSSTPKASTALEPGSLLYTHKEHNSIVWCTAWSPDGRYLASAGNDKTVRVWSALDGKSVYTYTGHNDTVYSIAWSPDSKRIVSASYDQTLQSWNALDGLYPTSYDGHTSWLWTVAWSPDGRYVASGGGDKAIRVWDAFTGELATTYTAHSGYIRSLSWSPEGRSIVSASADRTVHIWSITGGKTLYIDRPYATSAWTVAWSPDGQRIAVGNENRTVQLWDAYSGDHRYTYYNHLDFIYSVAWSRDNKTLASAGGDRTVQIWSPGSGKQLYTYKGHHGAVRSVHWAHDNKTLASAGEDKTLQVWRGLPDH